MKAYSIITVLCLFCFLSSAQINKNSFDIPNGAKELKHGMVLVQDIPLPDDKSCNAFKKEFKEPIVPDDTNCTIFRLIYSRAFDSPILFRIQKCQDEIKLITKVFSYDYIKNTQWPGKIIEYNELKLNNSDWITFINLINETFFWEMPSTIFDTGLDGSDWDITGFKNGKYHIVSRWCAIEAAKNNELPHAKEFYYCCKFLMELSKIKINKLY